MTKTINLKLRISGEKLREKLKVKDGYTPKKGIDYFDGEPGLPGTNANPLKPFEIRDKLESLKKGEKLSINAIDDLGRIIEELFKRIREKKEVSTGKIARLIR